MRIARVLALAVVMLGMGQPPPQGPPPGNPEHKAPPAGWYCRNHKNDPPAHKCECERLCKVNDDGTLQVTEDPKCRAYCFRDHCHCLSESCDG